MESGLLLLEGTSSITEQHNISSITLNKQSLRERKDEGPQRIGRIRVIPLSCFTNPLVQLLKLHISVSFIVALFPARTLGPPAERTYTAPHFRHFHNVLTQCEHQNNMSESVSDV